MMSRDVLLTCFQNSFNRVDLAGVEFNASGFESFYHLHPGRKVTSLLLYNSLCTYVCMLRLDDKTT